MDQLFMKIPTCVKQKMASEIKIEVVHKETIKPLSPTPDHLKSLSLSVFDQYQPEIYIPLLFFYPNNNNSDNGQVKNINHRSLFAERSNLLKKSLSEALTRFYPFAGEFKYNVSISCNDRGAAFLEAQVNCPVSRILENPDFEILKQLLSTDCMSTQAETGYLVLVQANLFECGGLAIGVSIYHKAADAFTAATFIKCWAALAFGSASCTTTNHHVLLPEEFGVAASLAPSLDSFDSLGAPVTFSTERRATRRFVFDASKISALKSKAAGATVPNPTRVEVVSAVIWKSLIQASRSKFGLKKPSMWCATLNMRKRWGQAVTENIRGNFVWYTAAFTTAECEVGLERLVGKLRKGIEEYKEKHPNGVSGEEVCQTIKRSAGLLLSGDIEMYTCSSWCRFPLYETDFGWGKPSWATSQPSNGLICLSDSRDGDGIEASLSLKEDVMAIIESSEDLLSYASMNPTVI